MLIVWVVGVVNVFELLFVEWFVFVFGVMVIVEFGLIVLVLNVILLVCVFNVI